MLESAVDRLCRTVARAGQVEEREDAYRKRLDKKYSALDVRLNALKATQTYLQQQIALWNNSNSN